MPSESQAPSYVVNCHSCGAKVELFPTQSAEPLAQGIMPDYDPLGLKPAPNTRPSLPTSAARAAAEEVWAEIDAMLNDLQIPVNVIERIQKILAKHRAGPDAGEAMREACEWKYQSPKTWFTTCGISTEVLNSCHKFCGFCGRRLQFGDA